MKIKEIHLETHRLEDLKAFYTDVLGFPLKSNRKNAFTVQTGESRLAFLRTQGLEEPFYHFAFNIPENQIEDAARWVQERTPLISREEQTIFHLESWNSQAIYFHDPAGNIVELIARHHLRNASTSPFSVNSILSISEIGVVVENVQLFSEQLQRELNLSLWKGNNEDFAAVGDEEGLFIVVQAGRPWFPTDRPAESFPVSVDPGL